jgi:hypothetical protein
MNYVGAVDERGQWYGYRDWWAVEFWHRGNAPALAVGSATAVSC